MRTLYNLILYGSTNDDTIQCDEIKYRIVLSKLKYMVVFYST